MQAAHSRDFICTVLHECVNVTHHWTLASPWVLCKDIYFTFLALKHSGEKCFIVCFAECLGM